MTNSELVTQFFKACDSRDCNAVMAFFSESAVWTNVPIDPPNRGKAQIRAAIEWFYSMFEETHFLIQHQVEGPSGIVMNERVDELWTGGTRISLPVMGIFKLEKGKIIEWRDYFDKSTLGL